jgi:hypothetical protein
MIDFAIKKFNGATCCLHTFHPYVIIFECVFQIFSEFELGKHVLKFLFNGKNGIFGHRKETWDWEENFSPMMCTIKKKTSPFFFFLE